MNDKIIQRAQSSDDVAAAVLHAMGDVMKLHGNDPEGIAIVAAGLGLAIRRIDEHLYPGFEANLIKLMQNMKRLEI
jgi:hypothetical protein